MLERRKIDRSRTYFGGLVAYNRRRSTLDCLVRNFSADGAKLAFSNMGTLPDKFDLMIGRKERSYRARVAWRGRARTRSALPFCPTTPARNQFPWNGPSA